MGTSPHLKRESIEWRLEKYPEKGFDEDRKIFLRSYDQAEADDVGGGIRQEASASGGTAA